MLALPRAFTWHFTLHVLHTAVRIGLAMQGRAGKERYLYAAIRVSFLSLHTKSSMKILNPWSDCHLEVPFEMGPCLYKRLHNKKRTNKNNPIRATIQSKMLSVTHLNNATFIISAYQYMYTALHQVTLDVHLLNKYLYNCRNFAIPVTAINYNYTRRCHVEQLTSMFRCINTILRE